MVDESAVGKKRHQVSDLSSATSVLEFRLRKSSELSLKLQGKGHLESHIGRRSGLRKPVTEAKRRPLEFRRDRPGTPSLGERGGEKRQASLCG